MRHTLRLIFVFILIGCLFPKLSIAQKTPTQQNLNNLDVRKLTDAQILQYMKQAEASGYSESQLELMAQARGMSASDISELRRRMDQLRNKQMQSGGSSSFTRSRQDTLMFPDRDALLNQKSTLLDPFGSFIPKDTSGLYGLKIFGLDFFNNPNLSFEPSLNIATPKDYQIGPGDQLVVDVWGASEQTYRLEVSPEGNIIIPNIGPIFLNGLTMERAESRIMGRLKTIYATLGTNTFAQVSLGKIRTIKVNIVGEVNLPGSYALSSFTTAFTALYAAGGPTKTGSLRTIQIYRNGAVATVVDAYDFLIKGSVNNVRLQDQDVLLVKPYENRVGINGAVKRPAYYELKANETLADAIAYAGGFHENAYSKTLSVRRNLPNTRTVLTIPGDSLASFTMNNGDYLEIDEIAQFFENRIRVEGAVNHPGEFQYKANMTVTDALALADGLRGDAFSELGVIIRQGQDLTLSGISFSPGAVVNGTEQVALAGGDLIKIQSIFDLQEDFSLTVMGEVNKPGKYPFIKEMTVADLIFTANGFKETAAKSVIEVARRITAPDAGDNNQFSSQIFSFAIDENLQMTAEGARFYLEPFDLVVIRKSPYYEKQVMIEIEGEVIYPGKYALQTKTERISDVLRRAGGLSEFAYPVGATLIRRTEYFVADVNSDEETSEASRIRKESLSGLFARDTLGGFNTQFKRQESIGIQLELIIKKPGGQNDLFLKEGDILSIPRQLQTVRVRGEVLYPSTVRYDSDRSFSGLISQAGGFTSQALKRKAYVVYANGATGRTSGFLIFKNYPRIEPGAEVIIPQKPERQRLSPQEVVALSSSVLSMVLIIDRLTSTN